MPVRKWNDDQLRQAVASSHNFLEVAKTLGISTKSQSGLRNLSKRVEELNIDKSHFKSKTKKGWRKHTNLESLFRKDCDFNTSIKRYFVESVTYKCSNVECGIFEWNGLPLTLQVDHIDGDNRNNLKSNLRLLCPNCHAQTETWGVPKAHRKPK